MAWLESYFFGIAATMLDVVYYFDAKALVNSVAQRCSFIVA